MNALSEQDTNKEINSFVVEQNDLSASETEALCDEEKQQAEAEAAAVVLAYLNKEEKTEEKEKTAELTPEQKKKAHEESEAKRKAEWEARQKAKEEEILFEWENALSVSNDDLKQNSQSKIGIGVERLTRRNMKICVGDHIQNKCSQDAEFARYVMHPRKNMVNCFKYINAKAREFIRQEMEDNGEKPDGIYGGDVPDDICYQWAEEYFRDLEAEIDREKDEKFVPKPYTGPSVPKKKKNEKKSTEKKEKQKKEEKIADASASASSEQIMLDNMNTAKGDEA